jgi:PKD repeat protein
MKKIAIYLACALIMIGCKKVSVDFKYSPAEPKAGEVVKFSNTSSAGESWNWDFGDNSTSLSKHPTKVFRKPGTYIITLVVDSAKYNTCSHSITVYDTIPTFIASTDSICHYTHVTLSANVYNPFGYTLNYQWELPENCVLNAGTLTSKSITVYFKKYSMNATDSTHIGLTITQNGKTYDCGRNLFVHKTKSPAIVMETSKYTVKRQHIINGYIGEVTDGDGEDIHMLELSNDTMIVFNDSTFYASNMQHIFPEHQINRLQIDVMTQKWYVITSEGLFVANFNGKNMQLIDAEATGGIYVDAYRNLLYWATASGLKSMPLVKSKNNIFSTQAQLYNTISDINRITVNNNYR